MGRLNFFAVLCLLGSGLCSKELPSAKLEQLGDKMTVSLADDESIKSILILVGINDECDQKVHMLEKETTSGQWISTQNLSKVLTSGDNIQVSAVFEIEGKKGMAKVTDFKIDNAGQPQVVPPRPAEEEEQRCIPSLTQTKNNAEKCSERLIFEDNFDGATLNRALWTHEVGSRIGLKKEELVAYVKHETNSYLADGKLHLVATWNHSKNTSSLDGCTSTSKDKKQRERHCGAFRKYDNMPSVFSAKVHTKSKFSFKFGRIEIRAKMPIGNWLFPYLHLQPVDTTADVDLTDIMRVAYARGNILLQDNAYNDIGGKTLFGSVIAYNVTQPVEYKQQTEGIHPDQHFGDNFHDYTMIWRNNSIIFQVDNITYGNINNKAVLKHLEENEMFIVLALSVHGRLDFPETQLLPGHQLIYGTAKSRAVLHEKKKKILPTWTQPKLEIDHVRVYSIDANEKIC